MRDRFLNESLRRLATEAATRLSALVASGESIPFDVAEREGPDDSLFHSYEPLTGRFVRDREEELRALPAFEPAREAVEAAGVAAAYLERAGEPVPEDPAERAARMLVAFLAALWEGCAELSLDPERLDGALAAVDADARDPSEAQLLIAPVAGLRMAATRLCLPGGLELVRADAIDAPAEARRSEGMGRAAWEPQILAVAEQGEGAGSAAEALRRLRELIGVMRLFKAGGVGLGPYAFAPTGEGSFRRLPTGAPAPRPGGYELSEQEGTELAELAGALEARPIAKGPLAWALGRFERGRERPSAEEGLSDHLLALRAVLDDPRGPVGASLPMRAAALIDGDDAGGEGARERLEAALELERALMRGARPEDASELAGWVEEEARRLLRGAALGELGADLGTAADETLIATGLAGGDAQITVPAQQILDPAPDPEPRDAAADFSPTGAGEKSSTATDQATANNEATTEEDHMEEEDTRILEPIPAEGEIRVTARDWLEEVEADAEPEAGEPTLDFPAVEGDVERRERIDTPRVRHLFPVPEDADWEVRELDYDHYRRERRRAG